MSDQWFWFLVLMGILSPVWLVVLYVIGELILDWIEERFS